MKVPSGGSALGTLSGRQATNPITQSILLGFLEGNGFLCSGRVRRVRKGDQRGKAGAFLAYGKALRTGVPPAMMHVA